MQFAPRIPPRRKGAGEGTAATAQASNELRDLITTKVERKPLARAPAPRPAGSAAPAARVAFQPSQPGQSGSAGMQSSTSGEERRDDVSVIVTHQPAAKIAGQHVEPEGGVETKRAKKEPGLSAERAASPQDQAMADAEAEDAAEAELSAMIEREHAYDQFLDNGDPRQYRPILLPFPKVRLTGTGAAARSAAPSPAERPGSAFGAATSMFDVDEPAPSVAAARATPTGNAPYRALPLGTPARLLGKIDYEEKVAGSAAAARNILFFQFPSHLPFKQAATWAPPVNPLLSLNGFRQSSLGTSTSSISFGANTNEVGHQNIAAASRNLPTMSSAAGISGGLNNLAAPSPSLQALHALSSPALPPLFGSGMPNFSLGAPAAVGKKPNAPAGGRAAVVHSGLMDDVGTSSALAAEEEQDLGEVGKHDPNKISESERLAREHKARQQRKLLLFSSNFEHAMRHLPGGQLGSLVIYKSGKIKMRIGDILLDVNEGVQCLFHQELMSVQANTSEAFRLGQVNHRFVCTNDVEDLVRKARERAVPQTAAMGHAAMEH
jgi:hypothetical protein